MRPAQQLYEALVSKPGLLFEVVKLLADKGGSVLGPWQEKSDNRNAATWFRYDPWTRAVARVLYRVSPGEDGGGMWSWELLDTQGILAYSGDEGDHETAMQVADIRMQRLGYVLVEPRGVIPVGKALTPWMRDDGLGRHVCYREDAEGNPVAWVGKLAPGANGVVRYYASVTNRDVVDRFVGGTALFQTVQAAREEADENLRGLGFQL